MKFVADESVDKPIVDALRADDHKVYYILEENKGIHFSVISKTHIRITKS